MGKNVNNQISLKRWQITVRTSQLTEVRLNIIRAREIPQQHSYLRMINYYY